MRRSMTMLALATASLIGGCAYDPYTGSYAPCCNYYGASYGYRAPAPYYPAYGYPSPQYPPYQQYQYQQPTGYPAPPQAYGSPGGSDVPPDMGEPAPQAGW